MGIQTPRSGLARGTTFHQSGQENSPENCKSRILGYYRREAMQKNLLKLHEREMQEISRFLSLVSLLPLTLSLEGPVSWRQPRSTFPSLQFLVQSSFYRFFCILQTTFQDILDSPGRFIQSPAPYYNFVQNIGENWKPNFIIERNITKKLKSHFMFISNIGKNPTSH